MRYGEEGQSASSKEGRKNRKWEEVEREKEVFFYMHWNGFLADAARDSDASCLKKSSIMDSWFIELYNTCLSYKENGSSKFLKEYFS